MNIELVLMRPSLICIAISAPNFTLQLLLPFFLLHAVGEVQNMSYIYPCIIFYSRVHKFPLQMLHSNPENSIRGVLPNPRRISQKVIHVQAFLEKLSDPTDPITSRGRSKPDFIRKSIATCDFPGESVILCLDPQPPPL